MLVMRCPEMTGRPGAYTLEKGDENKRGAPVHIITESHHPPWSIVDLQAALEQHDWDFQPAAKQLMAQRKQSFSADAAAAAAAAAVASVARPSFPLTQGEGGARAGVPLTQASGAGSPTGGSSVSRHWKTAMAEVLNGE